MHALCLRICLLLVLMVLPAAAFADPLNQEQTAPVTVPILPAQSLNGLPFIVVSAKVNNAGPFLLVIDSGAERNAADTLLPRISGLKTHGKIHVNGIGPERLNSTQTEEAVIQFGAATLTRQKFATMDMSEIRKAAGINLSGFLGENLFKEFVVRIDYAQSILTLTPPDQFHYHGSGIVMPLTFDKSHRPQIEAQVEGIAGKFMVDTGSDATLILNTPFVEKNGLRAKYASQGQVITEVGAGGEVTVRIVPSLNLQIGSIGIHGFPVGLSQAQSGFEVDRDTAGAFGGALLSHFTLTFDYSRKQLIFEPSTTPAQAASKLP